MLTSSDGYRSGRYASDSNTFLLVLISRLQDEGTLRLVSFAREELPSCLDFLRENSLIRRGKQGDRPVIYSTGIGGFQFGKLIDDTLQVSYVCLGSIHTNRKRIRNRLH